MKETKVKQRTASYLRNELPDRFEVDYGELPLPVSSYRADVVVYDNAGPVFAIECKAQEDVRKAIGQAATYKSVLGEAGVATPEITEHQRAAVAACGLHGFETGMVLVDEYTGGVDPDELDQVNPVEPVLDDHVQAVLKDHVADRPWLTEKEYIQTAVRRALNNE